MCLLNCGAAGSETMKNLVLGGIASFTVVDANLVEASDLGSNFLVQYESLGATRAATVCGLLQVPCPHSTSRGRGVVPNPYPAVARKHRVRASGNPSRLSISGGRTR